jgi:hypothetical protein
MGKRDHPRFRITENAAHHRCRAKTREAIRIPQRSYSMRSPCHANGLTNSNMIGIHYPYAMHSFLRVPAPKLPTRFREDPKDSKMAPQFH